MILAGAGSVEGDGNVVGGGGATFGSGVGGEERTIGTIAGAAAAVGEAILLLADTFSGVEPSEVGGGVGFGGAAASGFGTSSFATRGTMSADFVTVFGFGTSSTAGLSAGAFKIAVAFGGDGVET